MSIRTKADLLKLVASLPDDIDVTTCVDLGDVIQWMASPQRHYHQSGTGPEGTVPGTHPGGYPARRHYFLIFCPTPYTTAPASG